MAKRHYVVFKNSDGSPEIALMKAWLGQNPHHVPYGLDAKESTSYQLRRALRKSGWELEELSDRVLMIKPDDNGDTSFADTILISNSEPDKTPYEQEIADAAEITLTSTLIPLLAQAQHLRSQPISDQQYYKKARGLKEKIIKEEVGHSVGFPSFASHN